MVLRIIASTVVAAALIAAAGPAVAAEAEYENWPCFRGPTRQGISRETGLPVRWSATENVAWKTDIPGQGWSSPIVWGDRVFLTTAVENGDFCHVLCLDRLTGKVLWNQRVLENRAKHKGDRNSYASSTPATDGQRVYAVFPDGTIVAVDLEGKTVWTNRDIRHYSQHGLAVSPVLHEGLLIVPFDGSSEGPDTYVGWQKPWDKAVILAVDAGTGQARWRASRGLSRIAHVTPNVLPVGGIAQLVSAAGDVIQGHDIRTGRLIWTARSEGEGVVPSIVLGDGLVFAASGFGAPTVRAVRPDGEGDVTKTHIAWEQRAGVPMVPSFLHANGLLLTLSDTGQAVCLQPKTGQVLWKQNLPGTYSASPIAAEGRIYILSDKGEMTIIEASGQFRQIARNSIGEKCQASPAASHRQLFIRSEKRLWCIQDSGT